MLADNISQINHYLSDKTATLVAVTKTHPVETLQEAYNEGLRIFGENKVQEMAAKQEALPKDIEWHMIGHLQSNKVKYIAPFVSLIHSVDSLGLLKEIDKQAAKSNRIIPCLIQVHIAQEETKYGFDYSEVEKLLASKELETMSNVRIVGLMGMATNTDNHQQVQLEFRQLKLFFDKIKTVHPSVNILSMGMSGDYKMAIEEGSTMIRVGSAIFGNRN
jgi:PLP dependent protein